MALLLQCGLSCKLSQTQSVSLPTVWLLQQFPEEMPHTKKPLYCSYKPHMHTWTKVLKRNKSWRAGWSPFCFLSKSSIFAPQQQHRHHKLPSRYGISFPAAMCVLVDPCVVKQCEYLVASERVCRNECAVALKQLDETINWEVVKKSLWLVGTV